MQCVKNQTNNPSATLLFWLQMISCLLVFVLTAITARGEGVVAVQSGFRSPTQAMLHTLATNGVRIAEFTMNRAGAEAVVHLEPGYDYMILHERTLAENWTALYSRVFLTWNHGAQGGYVMRVMEPEDRTVQIPKSHMRSGFYTLVRKEVLPR